MEPHALSLSQGIRAIERGELTSEQWTRACLARIAERDPSVEAFAWLDPARALAQAIAADRVAVGTLHGAPIGVKDVFDTRDIPTRMGSPAYGDNIPARSATVVERLEKIGAFVLGKTVTAELAFYTPGKTRNSWNAAHTPGGSSSGSAAAVAAGFVPAALGTQTNASIIRPAAFCGCVGFKPSFGRVPRSGVLRFSATLDHVGFFTRTVEDAALLLAFTAGRDPGDSESLDEPPLPAVLAPRATPPRLLAVRSPVWDRADPAAQHHFLAMLEVLRSAGADVRELELPAPFAQAHAVHRTIMYAEGARAFADLKRTHGPLLSGMVHALIQEGSAITDTQLEHALRERVSLISALQDFISGVDAIITPAASGEAPATLTSTGDPSFASIWTLCGVPALTLPSGLGPTHLPLGTQLVGKPLGDVDLLITARWCEERLRSRAPSLID